MQPHVMLIVGNEQKFLAGIKQFESYVRHELKLGKRVTRMLAAYRKSQEILDEIWDAAEKARRGRSPFVLVYHGHGYPNCFSPNGDDIGYEKLGQVLTDTTFLFIDDSCYSGSCIDVFTEQKLLPDFGSVIAAAKSDEETAGGDKFLNDVVDSFRSKKPFMKKKGRQIAGKLGHTQGPRNADSFEIAKTAEPRGQIVYESVRYGKALDYLLFPK
ncbi:hypothetical protein J4207_06035 [Candidatus Woesearchaeota archaeon]|nr:hypothetical protein [Candidatus Woesearchaeota archaeon]